ncbi:hypothetical protein I2483_13890 [Sporosarcina sp. E16_3]|nr:hypothetical protein [Sporosarcina sp. E16_3]
MTKLAPAKAWKERHIDDWTTLTFTEYLKALHLEIFGIDYVPMGGRWAMEQGIIGNLIGTAGKNAKPRMASNESVKAFIDLTFNAYTPTSAYPGTSFGFMFTYRKLEWSRIQAQELTKAKRQASVEDTPDLEILNGWW